MCKWRPGFFFQLNCLCAWDFRKGGRLVLFRIREVGFPLFLIGSFAVSENDQISAQLGWGEADIKFCRSFGKGCPGVSLAIVVIAA